MLQHDKLNILGNCGFKDTKGGLWVWNKDLVLWDMVAFPHILRNNHMPCLQPQVLGCSIIPTQSIDNHRDMGIEDWLDGYMKMTSMMHDA